MDFMTNQSIDELREKLADIEHQRWADWQAWCHKILRENCPSPELEAVLERWDKQIATPYKDLSEQEKQSDRDQVDRYLPAIKTLLIQSKIEARIDENQRWANGYMEAFREYPELDNPEDLMAAKQDFEDRIKELSAQLKEELE